MNIPIKISSGFRSAQLNKMIKGSLTSQHTKGEAMDIKIDAKGFYFINKVMIYLMPSLPGPYYQNKLESYK